MTNQLIIILVSMGVVLLVGKIVDTVFKKTLGRIPEFYLLMSIVFILLAGYAFLSNSYSAAQTMIAGSAASTLYEIYRRKSKKK